MPDSFYRSLLCGLFTIGLFLCPASAQRIAPRGKLPRTAPTPLTLSVRDAVSTMVVKENQTIYAPIAGESGAWKVESSKADVKQEWSIDGKVIPTPEGVPGPAPVVEKTVRFIAHSGRMFLKVEILARPAEKKNAEDLNAEGAEEEIHFAGTYEASLVEGNWPPPEKSDVAGDVNQVTRIQLSPSEQARYSTELQRAFFSDAILRRQADRYRQSMIDLIERKVVSPGATPAGEIGLARQLIDIVRAHPDAFVIEVTPKFESSTEVFLFDSNGLHSTTERESWTLRFSAHLPAIAPAGLGR